MNAFINKKTVGGFFFILLVLLIFFSKTIYNYRLPKITAAIPHNGKLSKMEISSGTADWDEVEKLYAAAGGTVSKVLIREGEQVSAGQELFLMEYDRAEVERKLKEIEIDREKLRIEIEAIHRKIEKANGTNYDLALLELEIKQAKKTVQNSEILYEVGGVSRNQLEEERDTLQSLNIQLEELKSNISEQYISLQLELQTKEAELQSLALQEEPYQKVLEDYDNYTVITAPVAGQILSVEVEKGLVIGENELMAALGTGDEFIIECNLSVDNNFVMAGDTCKLTNTSHALEGIVSRVVPSEQGKKVYVTLISDDVASGETFDIVFEKESEISYVLVPNGALHQDNDGYYVYQIKRRNGIMGKEYYAERLNVYISDSDSDHTVIIKGITFFEPVLLLCDKPVVSGDVVNLENAGDFFEE